MSRFPLLLAVLLPLAIPFCSSSDVSLVLRNNTNIDYIVEVHDSLQFNSSESGFVQGTKEKPCQPPALCVEFYPRASSFLIKPGAYENYSAVSLSSSDNKLGHIAIVIVRENKFIPELHEATFIKPIVAEPSLAMPVAVVLDADIADVELLGNISSYDPNSKTKGLQVLVPSTHTGDQVYKIMRVTGTIKNESLSFSLTNGDGYMEVYKFTPQDDADMLVYPTYFLQWPNTAHVLKHSAILALAVATLNMAF